MRQKLVAAGGGRRVTSVLRHYQPGTTTIEPTILSPTGANLSKLDNDAVWATQRLIARGFESYLVGGCVRDLLLGRRPKDYDIATEARPPQVKRTFPRNCRIIGRRFKLAHLHFHNNTKILECSTFRRSPQNDSRPGVGDQDQPDAQDLLTTQDLLITQDNEFGTAQEDALRRDFTVNALLLDPTRDLILDYTNGLADLDARLIRTIGDPRVRFREDPVRILRAAKFAGRLGFAIEPETFAAMAATSGDLVRSAPPRVYEEILRLLRGGHALDSFQLLRDVGALQHLVPVLADFLAKARHDERVQFWRLLEALDHRILETETIPCNAVLLGVLLVGPVLARVERAPGRSASSIAEELLSPLCQDLRLPRRDAGCLKRICGVQHRFLQDDDSKRFRIAGFVHGPYFAEAFELFELRMQALGQHVGAVARWRELGEDLGEPTDADLPASLFDGDGGETLPRVGSGSDGPGSIDPGQWADPEEVAAAEFADDEDAGDAPRSPEHLDDMPTDALPRGARGADALAWDAEPDAEAELRPWSRAAKQRREAGEASQQRATNPGAALPAQQLPQDGHDGPEGRDGHDGTGDRRKRRRRRRRGRGQEPGTSPADGSAAADESVPEDGAAAGEPTQPRGPARPIAARSAAASHETSGSRIQAAELQADLQADLQVGPQELDHDAADAAEPPPAPATAGPDADDGEDGEIEFQAPELDGAPDADDEARPAADDAEAGRLATATEQPDGAPTDGMAEERDGRRRRRRRRRGRRHAGPDSGEAQVGSEAQVGGEATDDRFPTSEAPAPHGDALRHDERHQARNRQSRGSDRFQPDAAAPRPPMPQPGAADLAATDFDGPETADELADDTASDPSTDGQTAVSQPGDADSRGRRRRRRRRRGRGEGPAGPAQANAEPAQTAQHGADGAPQERPEHRRQEPARQPQPARAQRTGQQQQHRQQQHGQQQHGQQRSGPPQRGQDGKHRQGQRDHKKPRDVAVVPRHQDRRGKVEILEPAPLDLTAFDVELDPKRVPTFGSIVEGGNRPKKRGPRVPEDGIDDYRPPPPPGSDAPPGPPPPVSDQDSPDTFGDW
jgi:poly(A) polymerase